MVKSSELGKRRLAFSFQPFHTSCDHQQVTHSICLHLWKVRRSTFLLSFVCLAHLNYKLCQKGLLQGFYLLRSSLHTARDTKDYSNPRDSCWPGRMWVHQLLYLEKVIRKATGKASPSLCLHRPFTEILFPLTWLCTSIFVRFFAWKG